MKSVVEKIQEMRRVGAGFKVESYEDADGNLIAAIAFADGSEIASRLMAAVEGLADGRVLETTRRGSPAENQAHPESESDE